MTIGSISLVVKIVAALKELVVTWTYGVGDVLDVYITALLVPTIIMSVLSGSLYSASVPVFTRVREQQGLDAQRQLFRDVLLWYTIFVVIGAMLAGFCAYLLAPILASGFSPEKLLLTRLILPAFLLWLVIASLNVLFSSVLNANEHFALPAATPIISPVIVLAILLTQGSDSSLYSLVYALLIGVFLEMIVLCVAVMRGGGIRGPIHLRPAREAIVIATQGAMLIGSALISSLTTIVDQIVVATQPAGSVAALKVANQFTGLFLSIAVVAIGTSVMPYVSKLAASANWAGVQYIVRRFTLLILALTIPMSLLLSWLALPLSREILQHGAVLEEDALLVASIISVAVFQIPFYVAGILIIRVISSLSRNSILVYIAIVSVLLNAVLDVYLVQILGIAGIGLASALVSLINWLLLYIITQQLLSRLSFSR
jgi:putative peptidoglycan lipid II flippase